MIESQQKSAAQLEEIQSRFEGSWRLLSWKSVFADGRVEFPFGDDATGFISYGHNWMHAILTKTNRAPIGMDPSDVQGMKHKLYVPSNAWRLIKTGVRYCVASSGSVAYSGSYSVKDGQVFHHVSASNIPDWVGTDLIRDYDFTDDTLQLSAATSGPKQVLLWQRID